MPLIRESNGIWQRTDDVVPPWRPASEWAPGEALMLDVDAEPQPGFAEASAIAIQFPAFNDGRGLSLAVLLRTRVGFSGDLYATGEVHEDILHYMCRCGFNVFELAQDRDTDTALKQLKPYTALYQASVIDPDPNFRREHRR